MNAICLTTIIVNTNVLVNVWMVSTLQDHTPAAAMKVMGYWMVAKFVSVRIIIVDTKMKTNFEKKVTR